MRARHRLVSPSTRGSPDIAFFSLKSLPTHFARFPPAPPPPRFPSPARFPRPCTAAPSPPARAPRPPPVFPPPCFSPTPSHSAGRGEAGEGSKDGAGKGRNASVGKGVSASDATSLCTLPLSPDLLPRAGISRDDFYPSFGCAPPCFLGARGGFRGPVLAPQNRGSEILNPIRN